MRSPFLPTYATFPSLWLATLLAALTWGRSKRFVACVIAWFVLSFTFGTGAAPPLVNAVWTFVHTITAFVLVGIAVRLAHVRDRVLVTPAPSTSLWFFRAIGFGGSVESTTSLRSTIAAPEKGVTVATLPEPPRVPRSTIFVPSHREA